MGSHTQASHSLACLRPCSQGSKKNKANIKNADNLVNERKPLLEDHSNVFCNSFFFLTHARHYIFFLYNYPGDYRDTCALMGRSHLQRKSEKKKCETDDKSFSSAKNDNFKVNYCHISSVFVGMS